MATIIGTDGGEGLQASLADNIVIALSGNDTALGSEGNDDINGNQGDDLIFGSTGNDNLRGGQGNDQVLGEDGEDTIWGDKGNDNLFGGNGNDQIFGGEGNDQAFGNIGADFINGNQGEDTLWGGQDNDTVRGGQGNDSIFGDKGNDSLYGDKGADTVTGGDGSDNFFIANGTGGPNLTDADWFADYTDGTDSITLLDGLTFADLTIAQGTGDNANNTTIQNTATGEWLAVLAGVTATNITGSDFGVADSPPPPPPPAAPPPPPPVQDTGGFPPIPPPDLPVDPAVPTAPPPPPPPPNLVNIVADTPAPNEAGEVPATFTVTRSGDTTAAITVPYTFGGSATAGTDFTDAGGGSITIAAGATTDTITLTTIDDALFDPDESVTVTITPPADFSAPTATATATIGDNDPLTISIAAGTQPAEELMTAGTFTVTRTGGTTGDLDVSYTVTGTATAGTDYTDTGSGTVTIPDGSASADITLDVNDDTTFDPDETVAVTITAPTDFSITGSATVDTTIVDNELPTITIAPQVAAAEKDSLISPTGVVNGEFVLTRIGTPAQLAAALTGVSFTVGGTATSGTDYTDFGMTVDFAAGSAQATITVTPIDDTDIDPGETVTVTLVNPPVTGPDGQVYAVGGMGTADLSIIDDDVPNISIQATQPNAEEWNTTTSATVPGQLTLTRTGNTDPTATVALLSDPLAVTLALSGTATGGTDYDITVDPTDTVSMYDPTTSTVTFAANETTAILAVTPIRDADGAEGTETATAAITPPPDYVVQGASASADVSIADEPLTITAVAGTTPDETGPVNGTFTLTRTGSNTAGLAATYTLGGTATGGGTDYTDLGALAAFFAPGSSTATITLQTIDDAVIDIGETITLDTVTATGYDTSSIAASPPLLTIQDNDTPVATVVATTPTTSEGSATAGVFTITLTGTVAPASVNFTVTGTATDGTDYTSIASPLAAPVIGGNTINVDSSTLDDFVGEGAETVILTIDAGTGYDVGTANTATVTIQDNDGTAGPDVLTGTGILSGGDGDDNITATSATATLIGGNGNDNLTGVAGSLDNFRFNASTEGQDTITNFEAGTDKIQVATGSFGGLPIGTNPTNATQFINGTAANGAGAPQFIYDTATGDLRYDADGTAGGEVLLATLTGMPALASTDIEYV